MLLKRLQRLQSAGEDAVVVVEEEGFTAAQTQTAGCAAQPCSCLGCLLVFVVFVVTPVGKDAR